MFIKVGNLSHLSEYSTLWRKRRWTGNKRNPPLWAPLPVGPYNGLGRASVQWNWPSKRCSFPKRISAYWVRRWIWRGSLNDVSRSFPPANLRTSILWFHCTANETRATCENVKRKRKSLEKEENNYNLTIQQHTLIASHTLSTSPPLQSHIAYSVHCHWI